MVKDFLVRQKFSKLGYTSPMSELSCYQADCLSIIANEFIVLEVRDAKKKPSKKGRKK